MLVVLLEERLVIWRKYTFFEFVLLRHSVLLSFEDQFSLEFNYQVFFLLNIIVMLYGAIYGFRTVQIVVRGNCKNFNFYYFYNVIIIESIKSIVFFICHFFSSSYYWFFFFFFIVSFIFFHVIAGGETPIILGEAVT